MKKQSRQNKNIKEINKNMSFLKGLKKIGKKVKSGAKKVAHEAKKAAHKTKDATMKVAPIAVEAATIVYPQLELAKEFVEHHVIKKKDKIKKIRRKIIKLVEEADKLACHYPEVGSAEWHEHMQTLVQLVQELDQC